MAQNAAVRPAPEAEPPEPSEAAEASEPSARVEPWGWIELFVALQLLWGALLFIPGAQPYRVYIRAMPYVASLAAFFFAMRRASGSPLPAASKWLLAAFALLAVNLLHAETHVEAGLAQLVFQISIGAPMFWVARTVGSEAQVNRLLWIVFAGSFVSAALGVLQVYSPVFLPPEFSALALALNSASVDALSYVGPNGVLIVRPPGLSDLPGGAAVAGLTTVLLGVAFVNQGRYSLLTKIGGLGAAAIGMTALYLTQVRSLTIMAALGILIFAAVRLRQGRLLQSGWVAVAAVALVSASFVWASAIGGTAIEERFSSLMETGLLTTFQENRGLFLDHTFRELLFQFPLGAGLGRWGMMQVYFADPAMWLAPPIHVEIQITGWLLDGGVFMWICYGAALAAASRLAYRSAIDRSVPALQDQAAIVLVFQITVIGLCLAGPVFNTQLGLIFWTVTGALYGAARTRDAFSSGDAD